MNGILGSLVKDRRLRLSKTQVELADDSGIPQGTISRIERGDYKEIPPPEILNPLAEALGLSAEPFLAAAGYAVGSGGEMSAAPVDPERQALIDRLLRVQLIGDRGELLESILDRYLRLDRKAAETVEHPAHERHH